MCINICGSIAVSGHHRRLRSAFARVCVMSASAMNIRCVLVFVGSSLVLCILCVHVLEAIEARAISASTHTDLIICNKIKKCNYKQCVLLYDIIKIMNFGAATRRNTRTHTRHIKHDTHIHCAALWVHSHHHAHTPHDTLLHSLHRPLACLCAPPARRVHPRRT